MGDDMRLEDFPHHVELIVPPMYFDPEDVNWLCNCVGIENWIFDLGVQEGMRLCFKDAGHALMFVLKCNPEYLA